MRGGRRPRRRAGTAEDQQARRFPPPCQHAQQVDVAESLQCRSSRTARAARPKRWVQRLHQLSQHRSRVAPRPALHRLHIAIVQQPRQRSSQVGALLLEDLNSCRPPPLFQSPQRFQHRQIGSPDHTAPRIVPSRCAARSLRRLLRGYFHQRRLADPRSPVTNTSCRRPLSACQPLVQTGQLGLPADQRPGPRATRR